MCSLSWLDGEIGGSTPVGARVAIAFLWIGSMAVVFGGLALGVALWRRSVGPRVAGPLLAGQVVTVLATDYLAAYEVPGTGRSLDLLLSMFLFGAAWVVLGYHQYATSAPAVAGD